VFVLDGVAPTTSAALAPAANAAGWHNGPVTVTLSATDDLSGVNKTYYRLGDSGAYTQYDAAAKPVVSAKRQHEPLVLLDRSGRQQRDRQEPHRQDRLRRPDDRRCPLTVGQRRRLV